MSKVIVNTKEKEKVMQPGRISFADKLEKHFNPNPSKCKVLPEDKITLDDAETKYIINCIFRVTGITYSKMESREKRNEISMARHLSMYFIRINDRSKTLKSIGEIFQRDHSSVIFAIRKIDGLYKFDILFKKYLNKVCDEINPSLREWLGRASEIVINVDKNV